MFYELEFSFSCDSFEYFFSYKCFSKLFEYFIVDKNMDMVFLRKSLNISVLMLFHPMRKITRNSDIECSVSLTCEYVDVSDFTHNL